MLYVSFSNEGHYTTDLRFSDTPIVPVIPSPNGVPHILPNGSYEVDLDIKKVDDEDKVTLTKASEDVIWIIAQDSTFGWTNARAGCYGSKRGRVSLFRPRDTDVVVYKMEADSWFVSDKVVYHNDNGVLVKYSVDNVIGWESWEAFFHTFIDTNAIEFMTRDSADYEARVKNPNYCHSSRIYF